MKRILFLLVALLFSSAMRAQYPVSDASCAYCGVKLSQNGKPIPNVKHKSTCKYYVKEEDEESSQSTQSTHLKDYKPNEEIKDEVVYYRSAYGDGRRDLPLECPVCHKLKHAQGCEIGRLQKLSLYYYQQATNAYFRNNNSDYQKYIAEASNTEKLLIKKLKEAIEANKKKNASSSSGKVTFIPVEQAQHQQNTSNSQSSSNSSQHLSSVNIKKEYDKKLADEYGYTAYGKTYSNGQELWVLFDNQGSKIGEFAGVELLGESGTLQYFKVKGFNGLYGLYYTKNQQLAAQYTDIKPLFRTSRKGEKFIYFEITQTGSDGLQKHGLYDGHEIKIPCEYDRIELFPDFRVKVTKNGLSGVIKEYRQTVIVPVQYSYLVRYVSKSKDVYYIVGNGESDKLGAWDNYDILNDAPTIPLEYTLEQVRSMLDKR